jgi:leader peptidase (prepilin peptidase) / N-methyltransferase
MSGLEMPSMDAAVAALAAIGAGWGLACDRLAARWPAHEQPVRRGLDWRTVVLAAAGALAFGALPGAFGSPRDLLVLGAYFAVLVLLMATDLDQRLLPDELTLPLVPAGLILLVVGWNPLLNGKPLGVESGLAAAVLAPAFLAVTGYLFRGALGIGDLKLAVGLGLFSGLSRIVAGFILAALGSGIVLIALLATRRIGLRSVIPFGPVLIVAGFLAALRNPFG